MESRKRPWIRGNRDIMGQSCYHNRYDKGRKSWGIQCHTYSREMGTTLRYDNYGYWPELDGKSERGCWLVSLWGYVCHYQYPSRPLAWALSNKCKKRGAEWQTQKAMDKHSYSFRWLWRSSCLCRIEWGECQGWLGIDSYTGKLRCHQ